MHLTQKQQNNIYELYTKSKKGMFSTIIMVENIPFLDY